ncbi:MAG: hypothetical protein ACLSDJ_00395 [Butyricimonas faecihominis]
MPRDDEHDNISSWRGIRAIAEVFKEKTGCRFLIIYEYADREKRIMGHPEKAMIFKKFERKMVRKAFTLL